MPQKFLEIKNLEVIYSQNRKIVRAVNGVSFSLDKGKTLGLVGETGAGKTTIAKAILRILPDKAAKITGGSIILDGEEIINKSEDEMLEIRGKKVSMIFQDPMTALNPLMSVGDQIAEVFELHSKLNKQERIQKTGDMLEMVGIPRTRYKEYPHQFSGGMKQRVVIAMAVACNPELLLADEPTTALDVTIQAQMLDLIREYRNKYGMGLILITHDLGIVAQTCDNVAVIYAGQSVEIGSKEEIFDHPIHPYTLGLFGSLPEMAKGNKRLNSIKGRLPDPTNLPEGCKFKSRCPFAMPECANEILEREINYNHFVRCIKANEDKYEDKYKDKYKININIKKDETKIKIRYRYR